MPFTFWLRDANIKHLTGLCDDRVPRGNVLFICPSNVPVIPAYCVVFALMTGNSAMIKLSNRRNDLDGFYSDVRAVLREHGLSERIHLDRYGHDSEELKSYSRKSNARVIWGSDQTICAIRRWDSPADCVDVPMSTKMSMAIIDTEDLEKNPADVVERYVRDVLYQHNRSCINPKAVAWRNFDRRKVDAFWKAVAERMLESMEYSDVLDHQTSTLMLRSRGECISTDEQGSISVIRCSDHHQLASGMIHLPYVFVSVDAEIGDLPDCIPENTQTIVCSDGVLDSIRSELSEADMPMGYRFGRIGTAVSQDAVVDGNDILAMIARTRSPDVFR